MAADLTTHVMAEIDDVHAGASGPTFPHDPSVFRRILGHFPTGVVAITALDAGTPVGFAVGSFTSVSLTPPMVGFFPDKSSTTWPRIRSAGEFVVNILGEHQKDICRDFATSGTDKFRDVSWHHADNGAPIIHGATAWIACDLDAVTEAGDHWFVLGRVRDLAVANERNPLLFYRGRYAGLTERP